MAKRRDRLVAVLLVDVDPRDRDAVQERLRVHLRFNRETTLKGKMSIELLGDVQLHTAEAAQPATSLLSPLLPHECEDCGLAVADLNVHRKLGCSGRKQ